MPAVCPQPALHRDLCSGRGGTHSDSGEAARRTVCLEAPLCPEACGGAGVIRRLGMAPLLQAHLQRPGDRASPPRLAALKPLPPTNLRPETTRNTPAPYNFSLIKQLFKKLYLSRVTSWSALRSNCLRGRQLCGWKIRSKISTQSW